MAVDKVDIRTVHHLLTRLVVLEDVAHMGPLVDTMIEDAAVTVEEEPVPGTGEVVGEIVVA